jgi:hypothetical protein
LKFPVIELTGNTKLVEFGESHPWNIIIAHLGFI